MKKALVSGCAGFVGSNLTDRLLELGYSVLGVDNFSVGTYDNLDLALEHKNFELVEADVSDRGEMEDLLADFQPDIVFHLAALARIQPSIEDPVEAHEANLTGTLVMLDACRRLKNKPKFVFAGSSSIYGTTDFLPTDELAEKRPESPYAMQKLMSEQYIQMAHSIYGLDFSICRFFNVYGPRQILSGAYAAVVGIFLEQKRRGIPLTIVGDGSKRRDFTHVSDIVEGLIIAGNHPGPLLMNLGTGNNISVKELADLISPKQTFLPDRPGEALATQCDNTVAKRNGWNPKYTAITKEVIEELEHALQD